jgi:hypothetical protein
VAFVVGLVLFGNQSVQASNPVNFVNEGETINLASQKKSLPVKAPMENNIQTIKGVKVQLVSVQLLSNNLLQADMCFDYPSQEDWLLSNSPDNVFLTVGQVTIPHSGFSEIDIKSDVNGNSAQRCDYLNFPITPGQDLSSFTITINQLVTSMPDVPDCAKVQRKLDLANKGIQISCNANSGIDIKSKPSNLSDFDARKIVFESQIDTFQGPWVFVSGIK